MKTIFETTAEEMTAQILTTAEEVAASLPASLKKYADRKIKAARKSGTFQAAYKAGKDIELMTRIANKVG